MITECFDSYKLTDWLQLKCTCISVTSVQENDIHIYTGNTMSPDGIGMARGKLSTCQGDGKGSVCVKIQWYHKQMGFGVDILNKPVYVCQ